MEKFDDNYMKYTERFNHSHPGFKFDHENFVRADTARSINFEDLRKVLLSQDEKDMVENDWMFEGPSKYLDGSTLNGNRVGFVTHARMGSTFLRKYFEEITGVATGSDMLLELAFVFQIAHFKGESVIDDSVWITKSHHPFDIFRCKHLKVNMILGCVRNPFDAICSLI